MTNEQLYLAMGGPILFNGVMFILFATFLSNSLNRHIDDMRDLLRAEFRGEFAILRAELAKNHSELLAKFAELGNRLSRVEAKP
jgi:hypothetical protein